MASGPPAEVLELNGGVPVDTCADVTATQIRDAITRREMRMVGIIVFSVIGECFTAKPGQENYLS